MINRVRTGGLAAVVLLSGVARVEAQSADPTPPLVIEEWTVPYAESRPRDPMVAPAL